jgi:hypothetical protein
VTTEVKDPPPEMEVRTIMKERQDEIVSMYFHELPNAIGNMDETAFRYAIGPTHQYCPKSQQRPDGVPKTSDKVRVTACVTAVANGKELPLLVILKHSVSSKERPDQSAMTMITSLHKDNNGFGCDDDWDLGLWKETLALDPKNKADDHMVWYIINNKTGHVITSQHKAYMDQIRMLMYVDLVVAPYMKKNNLKQFYLWMDNFSSHETLEVKRRMNELSIIVGFYPPDMTNVLQVCDLVINGPIKRHTRTSRVRYTYNSFQDFKSAYMLMTTEQKRKAKFNPPKPKLIDGLKDLFCLFDEGGEFMTEEFEQGVARSFKDTGSAPLVEGGIVFQLYNEE